MASDGTVSANSYAALKELHYLCLLPAIDQHCTDNLSLHLTEPPLDQIYLVNRRFFSGKDQLIDGVAAAWDALLFSEAADLLEQKSHLQTPNQRVQVVGVTHRAYSGAGISSLTFYPDEAIEFYASSFGIDALATFFQAKEVVEEDSSLFATLLTDNPLAQSTRKAFEQIINEVLDAQSVANTAVNQLIHLLFLDMLLPGESNEQPQKKIIPLLKEYAQSQLPQMNIQPENYPAINQQLLETLPEFRKTMLEPEGTEEREK